MKTRRTRGFTLIEMLVAITVFLLIFGAFYEMFHAAHVAIARAEEQHEVMQTGRVLLDQFKQELTSAYLSSTATVTSLLGTDSDSGSALQADQLTLLTTAHATPNVAPAGDLCQVTYSMNDPSTDEAPGLYVTEDYHPGLMVDTTTLPRKLLSARVLELNCLYLPYNEDWANEWTEDRTTLPVAVRIELTLQSTNPEAKPIVLSTTANLTMATQPETETTDASP